MLIVRGLLVLFLTLSISGFARASDDDAQLDAPTLDLIHEGVALRRAGKDDAALNVFLDAEKHAPTSVRVLLHVTAAGQATGKWLLAYEYLQKAAAHKDDPYYQRYRAAIRGMEDAVAQHIGQFRAVGSPAGADVLLNGEAVGTLPMASSRVLVAGSYMLEVRKAGYFPLQRPITVAGGGGLSQEAVQLNLNDLSTNAVRDDRNGATNGRGPSGSASQPAVARKGRWVTWTLAGASAALFVASGVALAVRQSQAEHWNDDNRCLKGTSTRSELCGRAHSNAIDAERVAITTGVLGLGFAGAALTHYLLTSSEHPSAARQQSQRSTTCGVGLGSVVCAGSF